MSDQKLPPMVIFKRKTLPKEKFPARVIIKAGWTRIKWGVCKETRWFFPRISFSVDLRFHARPYHHYCGKTKWSTWIRSHHSGRINKSTPTVGHWCKQGVQSEVPSIVRDSKHTFNKTGRQQWESYTMQPGMFDGKITQLFYSEKEDEDFDGFVTKDWSKNSVCIFKYLVE